MAPYQAPAELHDELGGKHLKHAGQGGPEMKSIKSKKTLITISQSQEWRL